MPDKIFFQWQNETLLKTIYPKRKEKLIDFLVHYQEIELWKNNEKMPAQELEKWKKKFEAKQKKALIEIVKVYNRQKDYFLNEDVVPVYEKKYKDLKPEELERVKNLHNAFQLINPNSNIYKDDIRKEKIFVAQRVMAWEEYRRTVNDRIFRQRRRVNSVNENAREAEKKGADKLQAEYQAMAVQAEAELMRLESQLLTMIDDEMNHLTTLSSAYNKYEKRKLAVKKTREKQQADLEKKLAELNKKRRDVRQVEEDLRSVQGWVRRFNAVQSNDDLEKIVESAENIVLEDIDWGGIRQVFGAETKFLDRFKGIREYQVGLLKFTHGPDVKLTFVRKWMETLGAIKVDIDGKIDKLEISDRGKELIQGLQMIVSQILLPELEKLADYQCALDRRVNEKTEKRVAEILEENQAREKQIKKDLKTGRTALTKLQKEFEPIKDRLAVPEEEELVKYEPEKDITVNDIVIEMANIYRESLARKSNEELLGLIVQLFWDNPERFPPWLQYMVIHFSGMRYASAHGSWADPKELLSNLSASKRQDENRALVDEEDVLAQCQAWLRYFESDGDQVEVEGEPPLTLPLSRIKEEDKSKIDSFRADLNSENFYTCRKALFNLKTMQDTYEIEAMEPQDVLEALKEIREEEKLPDWMWNEIVAMTDLRIEEAKSPNWEKLTPEQEVEKNSGKWEKYRAVMNKWKADNLTDWRKEHEGSGQLIVTRAVCNEVAEHIQHMRGHEGAAGLTEKPNWYMLEEREFDKTWSQWQGERPYFKRPRDVGDFKEGASILWLRYVRDFPNEWRIAQPLDTKEKDGLIRAEYLVKRGPGNWIYTLEDGVPRRRVVIKDGREVRDPPQYLRWMHEATVAEVAMTAEGPVVLTFETALPYEDRRLSTIGVFKRYPHDLMDDQGEDGYNPAFVGFVPEEEIPVDHFKEMLDWNKILLREFKPPAELEAHQKKYIRRKSILPRDMGLTESKGSSGIKVLTPQKPQIAALPPDTKLYRAKNWGEEPLVAQAGLSALFENEKGEKVGSNFNPLPLFSNSGTWSAVVNALIIPREDIDRLIGLQVPDEFPVKTKMNWLVYSEFAERPYWGGDWANASRIWWGTILFGGQLVLVDEDATFFTKLPEEDSPRDVPMKRVVCFRKSDWGKTHATHPWLIQRATEVNHKDKPNPAPRGIIYSPLWSPKDWDFAGKNQPDAFYIPTDWLVPEPT